MESLAKIHHRHQPLHLSFHHHRPSFSRPSSSLSFRNPPPLIKSSSIIRASSPSSNPLPPNPKNPKTPLLETLKPLSSSLLKTACVAAVAATALFFTRFNHKPLLAAPIPQPTVETTTATDDAVSDKEKEQTIEEYLQSRPDDVEALRSLMEVKIKNRKIQEAMDLIDRLIQIEPDDFELPLLKAHLHSYNGESELAKLGFEDILSKDPLRVEAYHGLVMAMSKSESEDELNDVLKRIEVAMDRCKKEKKKEDLRDFKLLIAQIRVIEGNYTEALKVYQELVKEEPRDFRPYLCQGIIYTLLRKKDEAEKQFQKYRRLVPKGHPYAEYFDDNMLATKVFSQMAENQKPSWKS